MTGDSEWVEDVRRWYFSTSRTSSAPARPVAVDGDISGDTAMGYEAAQPALQARHWPDVPSGSDRERP